MPTTKIDAILAINPNAAITATKNASGTMVIDWLDTTPISDSDINAKIAGNSGYKLKKISPVIIELTN